MSVKGIVTLTLHYPNSTRNVGALTMEKCPYCDKRFNGWKSVRAHSSKCQSNDHRFAITLEYGPISYEEIGSLRSQEFFKKYPLIDQDKKSNLNKTLRKHGYTGAKKYSKEEAKVSILQFFLKNGRNPTTRDTYYDHSLPTDKWCKETFGSWNKTLKFCGLEENSTYYGVKSLGLDGIYYRSTLESNFADKYLYNKYRYEYEKPYPFNSSRISDFYLPDLDLYIEIAGGLRPEVIREKIDFCKKYSLNLKVFYPNDILKNKIFVEIKKNPLKVQKNPLILFKGYTSIIYSGEIL